MAVKKIALLILLYFEKKNTKMFNIDFQSWFLYVIKKLKEKNCLIKKKLENVIPFVSIMLC